MRKIQIVPMCKLEEMRKIFNIYLTELSEFDPDIKFDKKGVPIYKWFDCCWVDKERFPLYLIIDNIIAGFVLVREINNMVYEIAEFYVVPEYRKDDNAFWFATSITDLFDGEFTFSTRFTNQRAIRFWDKFSKKFERNSVKDDAIWRTWTIRKTTFKTNKLNLNPEYFELVKNGEKIYEGRLNDDKRKTFDIGDEIVFYKEPQRIENFSATIVDRLLFKSFDDMAEILNKEELGFKAQTKEQMIKTYRTFYTSEDENKYGVVVFKVKVIKRS